MYNTVREGGRGSDSRVIRTLDFYHRLCLQKRQILVANNCAFGIAQPSATSSSSGAGCWQSNMDGIFALRWKYVAE